MHIIRRLFETIDSLNKYLSNAVSLLFVPMTLIAVYEVMMRYIFNRPTTWAWDINVQLFALLVVFGAGNTLLQKGHVIMDILVGRFSEKKRLFINTSVYIVFIFTMGIVVWQTGIFAQRSVLVREKASTLLAAPVYPLKIGVFAGVTLLWLHKPFCAFRLNDEMFAQPLGSLGRIQLSPCKL